MTATTQDDSGRGSGRRSEVRALVRGLEVLRHVNAGGDPRPAAIARALGLPRPTVHRLVATLCAAGYLSGPDEDGRLRITALAAQLGDGYGIQSSVAQAAQPVFAAWTERIVWPMAISRYRDAAMVIEATTHHQSPLSLDSGMSGVRLPMLRTSAGRVYLAHCPPEEAALILSHLRWLGDPADTPFLTPEVLEPMLAGIRSQGWALRDEGGYRAHTSSVSRPVRTLGVSAASVS
ncbi:MAG: helix-turn-helix domain-containing protein, partial [Rhodobacteraceae bacterium]|nr:helix-turn-helix domain-containing protein [Paracoccaceae bacterium]